MRHLLCFSAAGVLIGLSAHCVRDASKGGDFGQIVAWALGVFFGGLALVFVGLGLLP